MSMRKQTAACVINIIDIGLHLSTGPQDALLRGSKFAQPAWLHNMCYNSIGGIVGRILASHLRPGEGFFRELRYTDALQSGLQDEFNENPLWQEVDQPMFGSSKVR